MFATYASATNAVINAAGNGAPYAAAVLADWVGLLTGTITTVAQLSNYVDKPNSAVTGAAGKWVVYDNDAHPGYPGEFKVLRKPSATPGRYTYLLLGFRPHLAGHLLGLFSFLADWDLTTKSSTYPFRFNDGRIVAAGVQVSLATVAFTGYTTATSSIYASQGYPFFNGPTVIVQAGTTVITTPMVYTIVDQESAYAHWAASANTNYDAGTGFLCHSMAFAYEHSDVNPWSNGAAGCTPVVYGVLQTTGIYCPVSAPHFRTTLDTIVQPTFVGLSSVGSFEGDTLSQLGGTFSSPSRYVFDRAVDETGGKTIPLLPVDVMLAVANNGHMCYAGRLKQAYATQPGLVVGDTFKIGSDTYVVAPTGAYNKVVASYSPLGKLALKVA